MDLDVTAPWQLRWPLLSLALAALLVAGGLTAAPAWLAMLGAPFAVLGGLGVLAAGRPVTGRITPNGLQFTSPAFTASFDDVAALLADRPHARRSGRFALGIADRLGQRLLLPPRVQPDSAQLYERLLARVGFGGTHHLTGKAEAYLREQEALFGPERLYSYRACARLPSRDKRLARRIGLVMLFTAVVWMLFAQQLPKGHSEGWSVVGGLTFFFGALVLVLHFAAGERRPPGWMESELVIGPRGLALVQGDVQGALRWDELHGADLRNHSPWLRIDGQVAGYALTLKVEAAQIAILDIYDRPLDAIFRVIQMYWRGTVMCPLCKQECPPDTAPRCGTCVGDASARHAPGAPPSL